MKKQYVEMLYKYAGLFEEVFGQDEDYLHKDNWNDYKEVISEIRKITGKYSRNTFLERIETLENQLP